MPQPTATRLAYMTDRYIELESLLMDVEYQLRRIGLWEKEWPSKEALASSEPFAVDTLTAPQWLQFVLVSRLRYMAQNELPLPAECKVAPYAEEYFSATGHDTAALLELLRRIDDFISNP